MAQAIQEEAKSPAKETFVGILKSLVLKKIYYRCFRCLTQVHTWVFREWPVTLSRDCAYSLDASFKKQCQSAHDPEEKHIDDVHQGPRYCDYHMLYEYTPPFMEETSHWLPTWWDSLGFGPPWDARQLFKWSHHLADGQDAVTKRWMHVRTYFENELDLEHYNQTILDVYFRHVRWYRAQLKYALYLCGGLRFRIGRAQTEFAKCVACDIQVYRPTLFNPNYIHPSLQVVNGGAVFDGGSLCLCPFCMLRAYSKGCERHCLKQGQTIKTWKKLSYHDKVMSIIESCQGDQGKRMFVRWWHCRWNKWAVAQVDQVVDSSQMLVQVMYATNSVQHKQLLDLQSMMAAQFAVFQRPPSGIALNSPVQGPKMFLENDFEVLIDKMTQDDMYSKYGHFFSLEWIIPVRRNGFERWVNFSQIAHSKKLFLALQEKKWL